MNTAFIPVRGGSKSIPLKNIKLLNGKPLVWWTAKAANDAECIDRVVIATDSNEIKEVVLSFNLPKVEVYDRDPKNASDTASTESVMLEYLEKSDLKEEDLFFLIQATSPMLKTEHIEGMYEAFLKSGAESMFTGVREKQFHWCATHVDMNICPPCGGSGTECHRGVSFALFSPHGGMHEGKPELRSVNNSESANLPSLRGKCPQDKGGYKINHRYYAPYIKEFARNMRKEMTSQEVKLWQNIRKEKLGVKFRRQVSINSKYIADFACLEKKIIIEIDGGQHCNSFEDVQRTFYLEKEGFRVVRFWNNDIDDNLKGCIQFLKKEIDTPLCRFAALPPQGGQMFVAPVNYDFRNRPRRQEFEGLIAENGACYINSVGNIKRDKCRLTEKIAAYELPSYTAYEIDEEVDWIIVETLMEKLSYSKRSSCV